MRRSLFAAVLVLVTACGHDMAGPAPAPPCTPGGPSPLTLPVGGVAVLSDPNSLACVQIAAAAAATSYLFVAANAFPNSAGAAAYSVQAAVVGAGLAAAIATARAAQTVSPLGAPTRDEVFELRLRATERRILDYSAARSFWAAARAQPTAPAQAVVTAAVPAVGALLKLRVPDGSSTDLCKNYFTVDAVVKSVGMHGIVVQDTTAPAGGFTAADFTAISNEFDTFTYPTDTSYFGKPTDLDNNGHVFILYTPRVNALTPRGAPSFFAGFFFGGDLFPQSLCPESNVGEIFYLLVPDPSGKFGDVRQTSFVRQVTRAVIAHEFEHMINLGVRLVESNTNPNITEESIWLDEALAHFAEEYLGRAEDGFTPFQRLTYANITVNMSDDSAFYRNNLLDLRAFLQRPDTASSIANTDAILPDGGAAWSLLHYTADQYAAGNLPRFTLALVAGPDSGLPNLTARAGVPFDSLMAGWMLALYADGLGIPGLNSRYTFSSWNYRDAETNGGIAAYPLAITTLAPGSNVAAMARPGSGNYFLLSSPTTPAGIFRILSPTGSLVSFPGARLYIVRAQ